MMRLRIAICAIVSMMSSASFAQGLSSTGGLSASGGGGINVGVSAITGTCTNGYILYNNGGILGCQPAGAASLAIGGSITSSTAGYGLYVGTGGSANTLQQFAFGTGVFTALGVNVGSAGAPVLYNGALGTPSSGTLTNATGLPAATGIANGALPSGVTVNNGNWSGTVLAVANGGTGTASPALVAGSNVTITGSWPNQTINSSGGASGITSGSTTTSGFTGASLIYNNAGVAGGITAPTSGQFLVGSAGAIPTFVTASGDCTMIASGAITCTKTSGTAFGALATVTPGTGVAASAAIANNTAGGFLAPVAALAAGSPVVGGGSGTGPSTDANMTMSAGALGLGSSGTAGSVAFGNATSGTVTLQPVTGALGSVTASLPANTGTLAELNLAQTWTAAQTHTGAAPQEILGANSGNIGELQLNGSTSGSLLIVPQAAAGTPTWTAGTSSGTPAVTASSPLSITTATGNITCATCVTSSGGGAISGTAPVVVSSAGAVSITGAAGQVLAGASPAFTATPTLGASGTLGTLTFGNATSGTVTLGTVAGALGSVTASLPANSGTVAETNFAQTWSAIQTFTNSDIALLGSSTGATTFTSANSSATNYTATVPANTGTLVESNLATAYTAQQNFSPIATVTPSSSTITWALASQQVGIVTLGTATPYTMAAPSGIVSGGTYILVINQGSTGTQLIGTWNGVFKFPSGVKPTLSTTASSVDMITCVSPDGTNLDCVFQASFQ